MNKVQGDLMLALIGTLVVGYFVFSIVGGLIMAVAAIFYGDTSEQKSDYFK